MSFSTLVKTIAVAALVKPSIAGYALEDDYSTKNFFDMFEFFTEPDPTNGFVQFVDQSTAQNTGLISTSGNAVRMGVDHTNVAPNGRNSVRLTSNKSYNSGLIILDIAHMPEGCGTWPAFWTTGPGWPYNGEIDIIEGVNDQSQNQMTLHTGPGCSIVNNNLFVGKMGTTNCDVNTPYQSKNAGCSISAPNNSKTYGSGLNSIKGGVYATEWNSKGISTYFFPRDSIPSDIKHGKPNPKSWGKPLSMFTGGCEISNSVKNQQIVFDTTFCGDWAGRTWGQTSCAAKSYSCTDYVANNPSAFADAYWEVNSLKVYKHNGQDDDDEGSGSLSTIGLLPSAVNSALPALSSLAIPTATYRSSSFATSIKASAASAISLGSIGVWSSPSSAGYDQGFDGAALAPASSMPTVAPAAVTSASANPLVFTSLVTVAIETVFVTPSATAPSTPLLGQAAALPTALPAAALARDSPEASAIAVANASPSVSPGADDGDWQQGEPVPASWFESTAEGGDGGIPAEELEEGQEQAQEQRKRVRRHARHLLKHAHKGRGLLG